MDKVKRFLLILVLCFGLLISPAAADGNREGFYCPEEFRSMDFDDPSSRWCWARSMESDHFFLFWEEGFGNNPYAADVPDNLRVNAEELLACAERFWNTNTSALSMAQPDSGDSRLSLYKMQIYLFYTDEWMATGAGYDNMIGALWVSPQTCQPVGSVIAHEIGHCFQYQVYCDQLLAGMNDNSLHGFRYGYLNSQGGNGFWEQCAQWASFVDYPEELLTCWEFSCWPDAAHLSFEHEWSRYQSYWLPIFWQAWNGDDTMARIWRESTYPEDAIGAYLRIFCHGDVEQLNRELYEYAARMAVFDLPFPLDGRDQAIGCYHTDLYDTGDGWQQIGYASCPQEAGFNVIELDAPAGAFLSIDFEGLAPGALLAEDDPGIWHQGEDENGDPIPVGKTCRYNPSDSLPGWRYGLAALMQDGSIMYGDMHQQQADTLTWLVQPDTERLFLVVVGAADDPAPHPWDDDELTDFQMPYRIRVMVNTGD